MKQGSQYFEVIRYAINRDVVVPDLTELDWYGFYRFVCEQAIAGVVFEGVKKLSEQQSKPPFDLLMEWIGLTEQIAKQNRLLNRRCVEVVKEYQEAGFQCCVLKGQRNAAMYPNPFSRASGDIDLWIFGAAEKVEKTEIIKYVKERHPEKIEDVRYYHVGYEDKGIEVEVHFMPNIMNNPVYHRRLQKWYKTMADGGDTCGAAGGSIALRNTDRHLGGQEGNCDEHCADEREAHGKLCGRVLRCEGQRW